MNTDPIADFLSRVRNASAAGLAEVLAPYSKIKAEMSRILAEEGYIWSYEVDTKAAHPQLKLKLKYDNKAPVIRALRRVSKPGVRTYVAVNEIPRVLGGLGISILSTSKGVMTGSKARKAKLGGELLALVW
ncbi:MAG: 30S ribosomal protein S8 [Verrucomicrobiaceae bacterium]|nr:30S ribosomal protein S8 [Verrucomicrobiaceae bacterium]